MIQLIPLEEAVYCENCRRFSDSKGPCIGCGAKNLMNMSQVMNRESKQPAESEVEKLITMVDETATRYEGEDGA